MCVCGCVSAFVEARTSSVERNAVYNRVEFHVVVQDIFVGLYLPSSHSVIAFSFHIMSIIIIINSSLSTGSFIFFSISSSLE